MTNSPNLDIPHLDPNSAQPEVPVNVAIDALDARITNAYVASFDATNLLTLTQDQQASASIFLLSALSPGPNAAITLNLAAFAMGLFTVHNRTDFPATVQISGQPATPPVLPSGLVGLFDCDGVSVSGIVGTSNPGGGIVASLPASVNLAAGDLINIFTSGGAAKMRKADATDATKPAHGFVLSAILSGASGVFYGGGQINIARSGLTPGAVYYLDTAAGGLTATAPSSSGNIVQEVGMAFSATNLAFFPKGFVQL